MTRDADSGKPAPMGWYDTFSTFYDAALEGQYRTHRVAAAEALALRHGNTVLDVPCGTGQSFDALSPRVGDEGLVLGVDASAGMLRRAARRAERWGNCRTLHADVHALEPSMLHEAAGKSVRIDRLHIMLGMTAFPRHEDAFARLWDLLAPGGRCVIVDVHADNPGLQGRMVNLVARADIRRRWWEPLAARANAMTRSELPSTWQHGGAIFLASGVKPA